MVRGARAQGERVGHNDTVNDAQTTSENIELVPLQEDDSTRRIPIISWRLITAVLAALAMVAILFWIPVPFVVNSPGPTFNVLGSDNSVPTLQIEGPDPATGEPIQQDDPQSSSYDAPAKPGQGQLRMVTVSESGAPDSRLNFAQLIAAYFDPHSKILDYDSVYPAGTTRQQVSDAQLAMMRNSQTTSQVAALEYLGWDVPATITIEGAVEGSNAEGNVEQGDILRAITTPDGVRHEITSAATPFAIMRSVPAGSTMTLTVERGGTTQDVSKLGVYLSADPVLPVDITVNIDGVGGPSAGMMFSLSIIDRLTPGDMTGGNVIAGTGTMSYDGQVGAIGGIQQKLWGAHRDGAQWFLAPSNNCDEVVGHVPDGLRVVSVSTLDEAVSAVRSIADGTGDALPTCQ